MTFCLRSGHLALHVHVSIYILRLKRPLDINVFGLKKNPPFQPVCNGISNSIVQLVPFY